MKKKILIALFVIAALVCMLVSCGDCEHVYEVEPKKDATCFAEGEEVKVCTECGEKKTEKIEKKAHTTVSEVIQPTCTTEGKTIVKCTVKGCGYTEEKYKQPATGDHTYVVSVVKPATCDEDGVQTRKCSVCGVVNELAYGYSPVIPAFGHNMDDGKITEPVCGVDGYITKTCKNEGCDCTEVVTIADLDPVKDAELILSLTAKDHPLFEYDGTREEAIIPATCTEPGYIRIRCTACGAIKNVTEFGEDKAEEALNHQYYKEADAEEGVHYQITRVATCLVAGEKTYICTRKGCGMLATDAANKQEIPMLDHKIVDDEAVCQMIQHYAATCTTVETKVFKCCMDPNCTETKPFEYGKALGHDLQVSGEQTCSTGGKTPYECQREGCGYSELNEPTNPDIRHKKAAVKTQATCCDKAVYECIVCGKDYEAYDDDALGQPTNKHVFDVEYMVIAPTCYKEGYTMYTCSAGNCGLIYGDEEGEYDKDVTPKEPHTFGSISEDGRIECSVENCRASYRDLTVAKYSGSGKLCLGCGTEVCSCENGGVTVEWNGYVSPSDPDKITAGTEFTKTTYKATTFVNGEGDKLEPVTSDAALAIGGGIISIKATESAKVTVAIYDSADGTTALYTFEAEGTEIYIDLYKYETVGKIVINSDKDATVALYK